jgi:hypothetical protein
MHCFAGSHWIIGIIVFSIFLEIIDFLRIIISMTAFVLPPIIYVPVAWIYNLWRKLINKSCITYDMKVKHQI